jgi:hypothetical protein
MGLNTPKPAPPTSDTLDRTSDRHSDGAPAMGRDAHLIRAGSIIDGERREYPRTHTGLESRIGTTAADPSDGGASEGVPHQQCNSGGEEVRHE